MIIKNCTLIDPVCEEKSQNIVDTANKLKESKARNLVVCEEGKPIGIVSSVDIVNKVVAEGKNPAEMKVTDIMSTPVFSCDIDDDVREVYFEMVKRNIFVCPVTENGKVVGALPMHEAVRRIKEKGQEEEKKNE